MKKPLLSFLALFILIFPGSALAADPPSDGVLIKFKPGADRGQVWNQLGLDQAERLKGDSSIIVAEVDGDDTVVADRAADLRGVEIASPNYLMEYHAAAPNDPLFTSQWFLNNTGPGQFPGANLINEDIGALSAWDTTKGAGATVGVVDSGMDISHEDLTGNLWVNPSPNGDPRYPNALHGWNINDDNHDLSDLGRHGTMMSGLIAAEDNNGKGISGVAPDADLMTLKAGGATTISSGAAIEAIHFAGTHGAEVVNLSFGGNGSPEFWNDTFTSFPDILFVAGSGNSGILTESFTPCVSDLPNVICVASTTSDGFLSDFSNYGPGVEMGAPGSHIYSTEPGSTYNWSAGTSQATAITSGVAALIQANSPRASGSFMRNKLIEGGVVKASLSGKTTTGKRISAKNSVLLVDRTPPNTTLGSVSSPSAAVFPVSYWMDKANTAARYECSLDGAAWSRCDGGSRFVEVSSAGPHTFKVRALDDAGNYDPSPASVTFTSDVTPPSITMTEKPGRYVASQTVQFKFASEPGASFICSLNSETFKTCSSPRTYTSLPAGEHDFRVIAIDAAGNQSHMPSSHIWEVLLTPPQTASNGPCFPGTCMNTSGPGEEVSFGMYSEQAERTEGHYECRLTPPGNWEACLRPATYYQMAPGNYKIEIRGVNGAGVADPTPWTKSFTITGGDPPDPTVGTATIGQTNVIGETATVHYNVTGNRDTVKCVLKQGLVIINERSCTSPVTYKNLYLGWYTVTVTPYLAGKAGTSDTTEFTIEDDTGPDPKVGVASIDQLNVTGKTAVVRVSVDGDYDTLKCSLKRGIGITDEQTCLSQVTYGGLPVGIYTFTVTPYLNGDAGGSASANFMVEKDQDEKDQDEKDPDDPDPRPTIKAPVLKIKAKNVRVNGRGKIRIRVRNPNRQKIKYKACSTSRKRKLWTGACQTKRIRGKKAKTLKIKFKGKRKGRHKIKITVFYEGKKVRRWIKIKVR